MGDNYWLRTRRINRRSVLKGAAVAGVGVPAWALAGCGDDDSDSSTATSAATKSTSAAATTPAGQAGKPVDGSYYSAQGGFAGITMDMHRELYRGSIAMQGLAYNSLLAWDDVEKGTFKGDLVDKIEQPDNKTFTMTLKQGAKFHNKAPANGRALPWTTSSGTSNGSAPRN